MRNVESWAPTKFALRNGDWAASHDPKEMTPASTVSATLALRAYLDAIREFARGDLADLGCGKVPLFGVYRDLVDQVTCVDWPGSVHESQHVDVFADLNQEIALPAGSFDTILSTSVLEHIWNHDVMWDEMARLLRPKGRIILGVPFIYWIHEAPHDYFRWTCFALARACEERGLRIVRLEPYGGGPDVLVDLFVRSLGAVNLTLAGGVGRLAARILASNAVRRLSAKTAEKLPLGYILVAEKASIATEP